MHDVLRYALFSRLAYIDYEITQDDMNVLQNHDVEAIAFIDRQTQAWLFTDAINRELVIAFRGSDSLGDLVANLAMWPVSLPTPNPPCFVHVGYLSYYRAIRRNIWEYVMDHVKNDGQLITICGHSLGGMCACLCALDMAMMLNIPVQCFAYGAPPGADQRFYDLLTKHTAEFKQIVHCYDFAPYMPSPRCFQFHKKHNSHCSILKLHYPLSPMPSPGILKSYIRYHSIDSYIGAIRKLQIS